MGPRPALPREVELYNDYQRQRLSPPLPEDGSVSGAVQHDGKADQQCQRRKQDQRQQGEYDVLCTPQHPVTPVTAQRLFPVDKDLRGGVDC